MAEVFEYYIYTEKNVKSYTIYLLVYSAAFTKASPTSMAICASALA